MKYNVKITIQTLDFYNFLVEKMVGLFFFYNFVQFLIYIMINNDNDKKTIKVKPIKQKRLFSSKRSVNYENKSAHTDIANDNILTSSNSYLQSVQMPNQDGAKYNETQVIKSAEGGYIIPTDVNNTDMKNNSINVSQDAANIAQSNEQQVKHSVQNLNETCHIDNTGSYSGKNYWSPRRERTQQTEEEYIINTDKVVYVKDLREKPLAELLLIAEQYEVQNLNRMLKQDIITAILKQAACKGEGLYCDGCLEIMDDGFGFLRDSKNNYKSSSYDVYISQNQIKRFGLRQGDCLGAYIKEPRRINDKYFSVAKLETVNGRKVEDIKNKINFDNLTPLYPSEKLKFDKMNNPKEALSTRVIDIICPIGKGQRALIVAPPRAGKTLLMQAIAHAINENHPEVELIVLLIDERPEEVTDMQRSVKGEVVSSTFDEPAKRHVELAEIVIEKARRMVEDGKDVVILLDSITRLARAYNAIAPSSGKVLTGGVDSNALQKPKRFFGTARNIENGGSLTIIATALIETGSKMDEVIFEEFKGTGNAEIVLDRKLAEKRLFPAIDILKSGTRKEEEMVPKDDLQKMWILRRILVQMANTNTMNTSEALEFLLDKIKNSKDNKEFFLNMNGAKSL